MAFISVLILLLVSTVHSSVISPTTPNAGGIKASDCREIQNEGLILFYDFPEDNGNMTTDYSTGTHPGTFVNTPTWVPGKCGPGLSFAAASSEYIDPANDPVVGALNAKTIMMWAKVTDTNNFQTLYSEHQFVTGAQISLYIDDSGTNNLVCFEEINSLSGSATACTSGNPSVIANKWVHIAYVNNGTSDRKIYVNGTSYLNDTTTLDMSGATLNQTDIARFGKSGSECCYVNGILDGIRVYGKALSAEAINEIYNAGR